MIKHIDGHAILENESAMKCLNMKRQPLITPESLFGFIANIPILVVIELRQEFRQITVVTHIGTTHKILGLGLYI